jgi:hypothetical protein
MRGKGKTPHPARHGVILDILTGPTRLAEKGQHTKNE